MTLTSEKNIFATYSMADYVEYQKTKDQNLFEEIIDKMMLDEVSGLDDEFKQKISGLNKEKKRMAILGLLDKDRKLFTEIKSLVFGDKMGKMDHIKDVILMLRKYVKVGEVEKKKFGEVMTPLELVKEMLATLPEEVWSNPNLKWLDPANGTGPYPMWVIFRLMKGLESWEKDEEKRYKHIVENMIYVCELQPKNMFLYMCAVDPWDMYKLNIYTGSFLESGFDKHMKEVWGVEKFDIVMGNPPYQSPYVDKGQSHIYHHFIKKSIDVLYDNKYLLFVNPPTFLKDKIDCVNDGRFVSIYTNVKKHFSDIGTSFIYFLIKKTNEKTITTIYTENDEFTHELDYNKLIPVGLLSKVSFSVVDKIYNQKTNRKFEFKRNQIPFPKNAAFIRRMNRSKYFDCVKTDEEFNLKVNQDYTSVNDVDNLLSLINSKLFKFFYLCYSTSPFITLSFINNIPFPEKNWKEMTDIQIYDYFNLSEEDKNMVELTIK